MARKAAAALSSARLHKAERLRKGRLKGEVASVFADAEAIVFVSAVAIAVRTVAPLLKGKDLDPAVIVVDELGRFAVSLVSGHLGGANELTKKIALLTGAVPVITTATDIHGLPCIEDLSKSFDLRIEDPKKIKVMNTAILSGAGVTVVDGDGGRLAEMGGRFKGSGVFRFQKTMPRTLKKGRALAVVSSRAGVAGPFKARTMMLRPAELVVGVGCRRGVAAKEVERAFKAVIRKGGVSPLSVKRLATIDIKKDEEGLLDFAEEAGLTIDFFTKKRLGSVTLPSGPSKKVMEKVGVGGVSEPAALLGSGAKRLLVKKIIVGRVTAALGRIP